MNIRLFKEEDYEMVCKWWGFHGLDPIPMGFLPAYGYVAHEGDRDIAVAWLDISEFGVHCYVWGFLTGLDQSESSSFSPNSQDRMALIF